MLRTTAWVATATVGYAAGVATGVIGSQGGMEPATPAQPAAAAAIAPTVGVLDETADRIAARAAQHVQRSDLERAAVEGMLARLDDTWSSKIIK